MDPQESFDTLFVIDSVFVPAFTKNSHQLVQVLRKVQITRHYKVNMFLKTLENGLI